MAETSVSGGIWADLFYLYLAIALVIGALVLGWLFYSMWKFRWRPDAPRPDDAPRPGVLSPDRGHPIWSYVMAILIAAIMFGLAFGTISALSEMETPPPEGDRVTVNVTGFQFGWRVNFTGVGGVNVARANEWTMPVDTPIVANVTSQDVWHNFAIPEFRMRIDAIPGEVTHIWFQATQIGDYAPVCVQLCGTGHALMKSQMHVVPKADFEAYLAKESQVEYAKLYKGRNVLNVTWDGATLATTGGKLDASRPVVLNVTNIAPATQGFTLGPHTITLAPGENGGLYARQLDAAPTLATSSGATLDLRSVS